MTRPDEREIGHLIAVLLAVVAAIGLVALVVLRARAQPAAAGWTAVEGPGFRAQFPAAPVTRRLARGGVDTALVGQVAYTVVWYDVPVGTPPLAALQRAVGDLGRLPATVLSAHPSTVGAFETVDLQARLARDFLYGRAVVGGGHGYLVAEIGPSADPPTDLIRLLRGFTPD